MTVTDLKPVENYFRTEDQPERGLEQLTPSTPAAEPKKSRKIAIIGTAPQWQLAPFDDESWEIWGIFGVACAGRRLTRLYEVHSPELILPMVEKMYPQGQYWNVARGLGKNYHTKHVYEQTPEATKYDFHKKLEKYGPHFGCSVSWLIADAIDEGADQIGIWGVNMAAETEYANQKPSASFMLGWARAQGIQVTIPSSSELLSFAYQYGFEDEPRFLQNMAQRRAEIQAQYDAHKNNFESSRMGMYGAERELALLKSIEQNWKA